MPFSPGVLRETTGSSWCEWKGQASYYDLVTEKRVAAKAGWSYLNPNPGFEPIAGAVAVMAALVDRCAVNGEEVVPQPGGYYGGWITSWVVSPFKGVPGATPAFRRTRPTAYAVFSNCIACQRHNSIIYAFL